MYAPPVVTSPEDEIDMTVLARVLRVEACERRPAPRNAHRRQPRAHIDHLELRFARFLFPCRECLLECCIDLLRRPEPNHYLICRSVMSLRLRVEITHDKDSTAVRRLRARAVEEHRRSKGTCRIGLIIEVRIDECEAFV